jgi:opacity protein-like surface antigen
MWLRVVAVAAWLTAAAGAACAQPDDQSPPLKSYVALDFGYHAPSTIDAHSFGLAPDGRPFEWKYKLNSDWALFGRVGHRFTPHLRVELEMGVREGNINSIASPGPEGANGLSALRPQTPFQLCDHTNAPPPCAKIGRPSLNWAEAYDGTVNVLYDIAPEKRLQPFIGAGVGFYHLQFNAHLYYSGVPGPIGPANPAVQQMQLGGSISKFSQFAYQGIGGVSYRLTPRIDLDVTYRYIDAPKLRWNTLNDTPGLTPSQGLQPRDFHGNAADNSITLGVRYRIN